MPDREYTPEELKRQFVLYLAACRWIARFAIAGFGTYACLAQLFHLNDYAYQFLITAVVFAVVLDRCSDEGEKP